MNRQCERCGEPLPIQTGRGRRRKFCSACSRSKNKPRNAPARVSTAGLYESVRAELEFAGVLGSSDAEAALLLARRIEKDVDPGSAIAQMLRTLREIKSAALSVGDAAESDPVDEFTARRREREGA